MKKSRFRNYQSFFIAIMILLFSSQVFAQQTIRGYKEMDEVKKFERTILHKEIKNLIEDAYGTYDPKEFKFPKENKLNLAGLAFIPDWDTVTIDGTTYFQTIGMRVAVVLWKPKKNCLSPEVKLASFANIGDALSPNRLDPSKKF